MSNDIKSGIGYIIPFGAIIGFFTALFLGEFLISIIIAIAGILVWFLYMVVMESSPPSNLGNLIIFFGILLSIGIFMGFGVSQNMWEECFITTTFPRSWFINTICYYFSIFGCSTIAPTYYPYIFS